MTDLQAVNAVVAAASVEAPLTSANALAFDCQDVALDNVDPLEAERYAALAATWWDRQGPFWPLHRLNALRVEYLRDTIALTFGRDAASEHPLEGLDVLDVGCGGGILSESMARLGARVHGIDVVQRNIAIAGAHEAGSGLDIRYEQVTVRDVASRGDQYDVVLNMEAVEHVPDMPAFMADCTRLVRPRTASSMDVERRERTIWLGYDDPNLD